MTSKENVAGGKGLSVTGRSSENNNNSRRNSRNIVDTPRPPRPSGGGNSSGNVIRAAPIKPKRAINIKTASVSSAEEAEAKEKTTTTATDLEMITAGRYSHVLYVTVKVENTKRLHRFNQSEFKVFF